MGQQLIDTLGGAIVFIALGCVVVGVIAVIVWAIARYLITALNRLLDD